MSIKFEAYVQVIDESNYPLIKMQGKITRKPGTLFVAQKQFTGNEDEVKMCDTLREALEFLDLNLSIEETP